jgi:hypothetical protein
MKCFYPIKKLTPIVAAFALWPTLVNAQSFTPGNIVVARVGDGSATLTNAATEVYLDEFSPDGTLVRSIAMPTSVNGTNRVLTASGNATTELNMTRSADGHYLVLTGYSAAPGSTSNVNTSSSGDVARVIGLIAADGSFDTSTSTGTAFSGTNIRAAVTADGTSFYSVGGNSGVRYQALGTFQSTQLNTAPTNIRSINIADGSLYISSGTEPFVGLSKVGTGLPTNDGQTTTPLSYASTSSVNDSSPYAFYFADLSADVPGVDVVYVADDGSNASTGGIQKWSLVGTNWVLNGTIEGANVHGLNGTTNGTTVSLATNTNTDLYLLADNTGYNAAPTLNSLPAPIATAAINTAFRGLAFAPVAAAPTIASFTPATGTVGTTVTVTGTNFTNASAVTLNGAAITGYVVVNATTLTFDVPAGATSGLIAITTPAGTATSSSSFTVVAPNPAPTIASLTPATAVAGSAQVTMTVNGTGFTNASVASFNGIVLATTLVTSTQLTAVVPASALTTAGTFAVAVANPIPGGGTSAGSTFTVTAPAPTIASFTPASGGSGTAVTITGTNFTGATAVSIGTLTITNFNVVSATTITLVLPTTTSSVNGFITVVTPSGTAISTSAFNLVLATVASQALPGLTVYPNPATDYITVELPQAGAATVALRDLTGRVVMATMPLVPQQALRLPDSLAAGIYLLEVQQGAVKAVRRIEKK